MVIRRRAGGEQGTMSTASNAAVIRRFYAAGPPDDDRERAVFAVPDVIWHVPGENPVAGTYQGYDAVFSQIAERTQPLEVLQLDVVDVMANLDTVVATVRLVAARGEASVATTGAHVFRFGADGRIAEVWGFVAHQAGLDQVFRARPRQAAVRTAKRSDLTGAAGIFTTAFARTRGSVGSFPTSRTGRRTPRPDSGSCSTVPSTRGTPMSPEVGRSTGYRPMLTCLAVAA